MKMMKRLSLSRFLMALAIVTALTVSVYGEEQSELSLVYYGTETCLYCVEAKSLLDEAVEKHDGVTMLDAVDTRSVEGTALLRETAEAFDVTPMIPLVIVNGQVPLVGLDEIKAFLEEGKLESYIAAGETGIVGEGRGPTGFTLPVILVAGLLDGLNPCALAMLMFLLSYVMAVGVQGEDYKRILYVGWIYAAATFLTYFVIGAGLMTFLLQLRVLPLAMKVIYTLTVVFCLTLAALNLHDFWQLQSGRENKVKTQLPKKFKHAIHKLVRRKVSPASLYVTTFFVSVLISLIDFLCTGQIYLPTLTFMLSASPQRWELYGYLALYNLMFIVPIVAVFYAVYVGKTVLSASEILTRRLKMIKLAGAVFYVAIAGYVGYVLVQVMT